MASKIVELLIRKGVLSLLDYQKALRHKAAHPGEIESILEELGFVTKEQLEALRQEAEKGEGSPSASTEGNSRQKTPTPSSQVDSYKIGDDDIRPLNCQLSNNYCWIQP